MGKCSSRTQDAVFGEHSILSELELGLESNSIQLLVVFVIRIIQDGKPYPTAVATPVLTGVGDGFHGALAMIEKVMHLENYDARPFGTGSDQKLTPDSGAEAILPSFFSVKEDCKSGQV